MGITDAKRYVGKRCVVRWLDRVGDEVDMVSTIHDVTYVPMYGGYIITDTEDIRLDRIVALRSCDEAVPAAA